MQLISALQMEGHSLEQSRAIIAEMKERMKNGEQAYEVLEAYGMPDDYQYELWEKNE